jgi:nucleotide-binding universal stress UspA family protein
VPCGAGSVSRHIAAGLLRGRPARSPSRRAVVAQAAAAAEATLPDAARAPAEVLLGPAVDTLAEASDRFDLLVCRSRGYGALRSVLAGGVSRGLAHAARCPLLVVPRGDGASAIAVAA